MRKTDVDRLLFGMWGGTFDAAGWEKVMTHVGLLWALGAGAGRVSK